MHAAEDCRRIHEPVQALPVTTEAPHPTCGRRHGERHQHQECGEPDGNVRALDDVSADGRQVEPLVEHQPVEEVQAQVGKGVEAEHASQAHQPRFAQLDGERRNEQGGEQQAQAPVAEPIHDLVDRVWPEARACDAERTRKQPRERQRAEDEDERLQVTAHGVRCPAIEARTRQKFFRKSKPR